MALPFEVLFASALRGDPCTVEGLGGEKLLPVGAWADEADASDRVLLGHCHGPTIDIGCGPGRMCAELARAGRVALGIDLVAEAVAQTRERGASALQRDVFGPVPGEGRWQTALLADGNVGIGGEPVRLLSRIHRLLRRDGRVVVDVAPHGIGLRQRWVRLQTREGVTPPFRWALVGADVIGELALEAGFASTALREHDARWFAIIAKED